LQLDPYEEFIKAKLENCEDASTAQVHDWLKEHYNDFIDVNEKTVFNFVLYVRNKHRIPKPFNHRDDNKVEELSYGKQANSFYCWFRAGCNTIWLLSISHQRMIGLIKGVIL